MFLGQPPTAATTTRMSKTTVVVTTTTAVATPTGLLPFEITVVALHYNKTYSKNMQLF